VQIDYLANHPWCCSQLAAWHHQEWNHYHRADSVAKRLAKLQAEPGFQQIPTTFVALAGNTLLGSASLVEFDMHDRLDLTPWLASVFVAPSYRRQGVGGSLVQRVVAEAKVLGVSHLYLFTPDQENWYEKLGWSVVQRTQYQGYPAVIMSIRP
jgi:predicted N-acetyltransferase YhbS